MIVRTNLQMIEEIYGIYKVDETDYLAGRLMSISSKKPLEAEDELQVEHLRALQEVVLS